MTVYFISGLGADKRVFQKLSLPKSWNVQHLDWIPVLQNESLSSYCERMSLRINTTEAFVLVGLSFGGIVAIELNKIVQPQLTILLSSISTKDELPNSFRLLGKLGINKIIPAFLLNKVHPFTSWFFGVKTNDSKQLLRHIIHDTPASFLKWAINEIVNWKNTIHPANLIHIHGTADHIFPVRKTKADIKIDGGGHFTVFDKSEDVSGILIKYIGE